MHSLSKQLVLQTQNNDFPQYLEHRQLKKSEDSLFPICIQRKEYVLLQAGKNFELLLEIKMKLKN